MKLLEKIKDEYAKEQGFDSYEDMYQKSFIFGYRLDAITTRYAKAVLERAAENARMETVFTEGGERTIINKESITNTKLD